MAFTLRTAIPGHPPVPVPVATEIAPGLYVHRVGEQLLDIDDPRRAYDWAVSHHEGVIILYSICHHAAVDLARKMAPLTDWAVGIDDIRKQYRDGLGRKVEQVRQKENLKPARCAHR